MKVSKRDISIVMILLGAIALFCVYQFNYRKQIEKAESLEKEIKVKTEENEKLLKIDEQQINNDITKWQNELIAMVKSYPSGYRYDDLIMYLYDLEHVEEYGVRFHTYHMFPSNLNVIDTYSGSFNEKSVLFCDNLSKISLAYENATYEGCKKMLSSVYADRMAKNIEEIELTYDNFTGIVKGSMILRAYGVTDFSTLGQGKDTNFPPAEVYIPEVTQGVDCVFGPTVTPVPTLEIEPPTP
ncbi:MAG: hypothetical protein J6Y20_02320 [Lachnospiraceae bacterium]|nr:hypothetical protein [Lachnospiraceae bacterium]